jgi:pyruvate ferredoxin oxidoreductase alpha subunit
MASVLYGMEGGAPLLVSFIGGLGGRDISLEELYEMASVTRKAVETGKTPPPRMLYTEGELLEMRKLQAVANVERRELGPSR